MKLVRQFSFALLLSLAVVPASRAQVRPLTLEEIVQSAETSFIGTVTGTRYGYDAQHDIVTYTTFRVEETVTGHPGPTVTIKQLGGVMDGLDTRLAHIRYFTKGEKVLVSIYGTSSLGFSNPVGLDQGVWPVTRQGMVLNVTPHQLQGLAPVLPQYGISSNAATERGAQSINTKRFTSLMRALSMAHASNEKGAGGQ
jgi:hypothetical protein